MHKFYQVLALLSTKLTNQNLPQKLLYLVIIMSCLCLIATTICAFLGLGRFQSQTIGTVNITGIVNNFITTQAKHNIANDELKQSVKNFGLVLEKTMVSVSNQKHVVLLPAEAVITGAKDYTQAIQNLLPMPKKQPQVASPQIAPMPQHTTMAPNLKQQCLLCGAGH